VQLIGIIFLSLAIMRLAGFIFKTAEADEVGINSYGLAKAGLIAVVLNLFIPAPQSHYLPGSLQFVVFQWSAGAYALGLG